MNTNGDFVSRVMGNLKALTKDGHISQRLVLSIGKDKSRFYMSQKLDEMTLFKEKDIVTNIECFRLDKINAKYCDILEFRKCDKIMKSVKKLPEGIYGKNGSGVLNVESVDGGTVYHRIEPRRYKGLKKRKYKTGDKKYYYTKDGYLYLLNTTAELVDLDVITLDEAEAQDVSECSDDNTDDCESVWGKKFVCPDRFYDRVVQETERELGNLWMAAPKDTNPNLDENQKQKTTI